MSEQAQAAGQDNTAPQAQGNDQATASTLLTGAASAPPADKTEAAAPDATAEKQGTEGAETKPEGEGKDKPEGAPEKYELKAPEGFEQIDPALMESFEPVARELGLTNEAAQKLVETQMPKVVERITEQHREAWGKQLETWVSDVKADKEIGGEQHAATLQTANRALTKFATPELLSLLDYPSETNPKGLGLGNHPELVRVFARIGKAMAEDTLANGNGAPGAKKDAAEIMFGNSQK